MGQSTDGFAKKDRELVIIDASIEQYYQLIQGIKPGLDWVVLNSQQDGIEQITRILANTPNIKALHIVSHGSPGCLFLGNALLNQETLNNYAFQLKSWFSNPFILDNNLLIYGCNIASGESGQNFITKLHRLTKANIAASRTLTGNTALNGDWDLDFIIGKIKPELAFDIETQAAYAGVLGDIFISEYIEGSSYNKALELYNSTGESIDLAAEGYTLELYSNGSSTPDKTVNLSGILATGDVFVIAHPSANESILSVTNLQTNVVNFNGNDTIVLKKNGIVIDSFGQIGVDPGEEWISGEVGTKDRTLRRKSSILTGDSNPNDQFDPAIEWEAFPNNTLDGLGLYDNTFDHTAPFDLTISEIMYDPNSTDENWEWIEVYNPNDVAVDLSGYILDDDNGKSYNTANITSGTIAAKNTAILYDGNNTDFAIAWGSEINLIPVNDWSKMALNNTGDKVSLWSNFLAYSGDHRNHANAVDTVDYRGANFSKSTGASIYLKDLTADNNDGNNWVVSVDRETTPNGIGFTDQIHGSIGSPGGNFAPNAADKTVTIPEDNSYTFQVSDFGFNDINSEDTLQKVKITQLQTLGQLKLDGVEVILNQEINTSNLDKLTFTPAENNYGIAYDRFQFQVSDGQAYSTAHTITIDVTAVDDEPVVQNAIADIIIDEDAANQIIDLSNVFTDIDNDDIEIFKALKSNTNTELVQVNLSDNILTLDFQENQNGFTEITIEAISNSKTITDTFTVTVNAINDLPLEEPSVIPEQELPVIDDEPTVEIETDTPEIEEPQVIPEEELPVIDDESNIPEIEEPQVIPEEELPVVDDESNIPEIEEPQVTPEEELPVVDDEPNIEIESNIPEIEEPPVIPEEELPVVDDEPTVEIEPNLPEIEEPSEELPVDEPNVEIEI
ncbi:MAG: DUF4347 domain-containing protein, partial [Cyanobacteriota bacterium]|nr:DUF4347 domain-containing protein [Cyanobacteriota bacterium]